MKLKPKVFKDTCFVLPKTVNKAYVSARDSKHGERRWYSSTVYFDKCKALQCQTPMEQKIMDQSSEVQTRTDGHPKNGLSVSKIEAKIGNTQSLNGLGEYKIDISNGVLRSVVTKAQGELVNNKKPTPTSVDFLVTGSSTDMNANLSTIATKPPTHRTKMKIDATNVNQ